MPTHSSCCSTFYFNQAGCDLLTISPALLEELSKSTEKVTRKLSVEHAKSLNTEKVLKVLCVLCVVCCMLCVVDVVV